MGISKKQRKGFMFAFVTIFLISIFVFVVSVATSNIMQAQQQAAAERTEAIVVNMFTKSLRDDYFNMFSKIAGTTSIRAMGYYINRTETALEDPEGFYREVMVNGTVPTYYDVTAGSSDNDFVMTLIARNGSEEITVAKIAAETTTEFFGNEIAIAQRIAASENIGDLENIKSIELTIEDNGASSKDLYLLLYNSTQQLLGIDHQAYQTDTTTYLFTFGGHFALKTEEYYDIVLAAPFADSNTAYTLYVTSSDQFSCSLSPEACEMATWEILDPSETTGDVQNVPIDFHMDHVIVGEGFLRALTNSFEGLGKNELNIDTWINVSNISVVEESPWTMTVNTSFVVSTSKTTVAFSDIATSGEAEISVIGLYDPYSLLMKYDSGSGDGFLDNDRRYFQIVEQNLSEDFDEEDISRHIIEHTFVFSESAPSFLERFKGEDASSSSCCGIQAIYLDDDISNSVSEDDNGKGYSYVDYMFQESGRCSSDDITINPLYYPYVTSSSSALYGVSSITSGPWFDYASIEFYYMDEMDDITVGDVNCPTPSSGS